MILLNRSVVAVAISAVVASAPAVARAEQAQQVIDENQIPRLAEGEGQQVAAKLADLLEQRYTITAIGKTYAATLRANAAAGKYDIGNWKQLCDWLKADLNAVHPDKHLNVNAGVPTSPGARPTKSNPVPASEAGQWAAPGVLYLRLNRFTGEVQNISAIRRFLVTHPHAKTVILDLRGHHGGRFEEMDAIIPLLYARRTALLDMAIARATEEENGPLAESPSLALLPGDGPLIVRRHWAIADRKHPGLQHARLFVLTSSHTGSAGEHLADALKVSKRAVLIGEPTAGANHFGGEVPLSDHFYAFIPMGRTYDPKTGEDWEGVGVKPNVAVPAADALKTALDRAGVKDAATVARKVESRLTQPAA